MLSHNSYKHRQKIINAALSHISEFFDQDEDDGMSLSDSTISK